MDIDVSDFLDTFSRIAHTPGGTTFAGHCDVSVEDLELPSAHQAVKNAINVGLREWEQVKPLKFNRKRPKAKKYISTKTFRNRSQSVASNSGAPIDDDAEDSHAEVILSAIPSYEQLQSERVSDLKAFHAKQALDECVHLREVNYAPAIAPTPSTSISNSTDLGPTEPDVVIRLAVYHREQDQGKDKKMNEFEVLGTTVLSDLRDRITCMSDKALDGAKFVHSGYFFAAGSGTFHDDTDHSSRAGVGDDAFSDGASSEGRRASPSPDTAETESSAAVLPFIRYSDQPLAWALQRSDLPTLRSGACLSSMTFAELSGLRLGVHNSSSSSSGGGGDGSSSSSSSGGNAAGGGGRTSGRGGRGGRGRGRGGRGGRGGRAAQAVAAHSSAAAASAVAASAVAASAPLLFCHQGNCIHPIVLLDVRMLRPAEHAAIAAARALGESPPFPRRTFAAKPRKAKCGVCALYPAWLVTYGDRLAPTSPAFFCSGCYRALHYNAEGALIRNDFAVYPYYCDDS